MTARRRRPDPRSVGLALAGGGPFGAIYEIGALVALQESLEGLDLNDLDCYVGVSAGSFLAAALANGIPVGEIYRLFIDGGEGQGALTPELFMRPALREYARRARSIPPLVLKSTWRYVKDPLGRSPLEPLAALGRALPTGLFENESIHRYLASVFSQPGRTNDFRSLKRRLFLVATDLDSGQSVSFGRPGHDHVPISKAVQASAALPGLFPPVQVGGHWFVDGALRKTLHASEALEEGMGLVLCVNPIVPFDAKLAVKTGRAAHSRLVEGGLPVVLSQTFRAVIHSRMATGLAGYRTQYKGSDVVLFQPDPDDSQIFFTNVFSYSQRQWVCEHAYARTRADLARRARELEPILARHGIGIRHDRLADPHRKIGVDLGPAPRGRLPEAVAHLRHALGSLRGEIDRRATPRRGLPRAA